jgi:hypothetical protein
MDIQNWSLYLAHIRQLPFVRGASEVKAEAVPSEIRADNLLQLETEKGPYLMKVEARRGPLTQATVAEISTRLGKDPSGHILFVRQVSRDLARQLAKSKINFVDLAGNCHLALKKGLLVYVEGKRDPSSRLRDKTMRGTGYKVLFALLVRPELAAESVRALARAAGVSKSAAAEVRRRLQAEGALGRSREGLRLLPNRRLLDRWLTGYADLLRPSLLIGRYRAQEQDPFRLESQLEGALDDSERWAWGGAAAAFRLTRHFRGEQTTLHIEGLRPGLLPQLELVPDRHGRVSLLKPPGPLAFDGIQPRTAHPLLIYSELLVTGGEREGEAAAEIRERYLDEMQ